MVVEWRERACSSVAAALVGARSALILVSGAIGAVQMLAGKIAPDWTLKLT